ncbi:hypothetical protein MPSI1_002770 [Malassezia psittaci]|uniref:DASH complex subunit ASK1 n=1 Tax=Malassezia psittaci TaxID=1821823 RepID=A0AAF0FAY4_9BASI|nr:hypothetical protein MPSI1_002770 [Malassezia psittaci]
MVAPLGHGNEPMAVGEQLMQLDQAITITLQEIDQDFAQAHQVVTARILPAIREYESACERTWSAARFWKQFFEASAQVSLSHQPFDQDLDVSEDHSIVYANHQTDSSSHDADHIRNATQHSAQDSNAMQSPPRLSHSIYAPNDDTNSPRELESPFQRLKRDVEQSILSGDTPAQSRRDASQLQDVSVTMAHDASVSLNQHPIPRSSSPLKSQSRRRSSARPRVSVVGEPSANPFSSEQQIKRWDGIADLRTTPLRGTPLRSVYAPDPNESADGSLDATADSNATLQRGPFQKYRDTPAKQAASQVVDEVLRTAHEPTPSYAPASRRKSVVGTPLVKHTPSRQRRDSMPTPPTITKVHRAPSQPSPNHDSDLEQDPDNSANVSHIPGMLDQMLALDDASSHSDTDESQSSNSFDQSKESAFPQSQHSSANEPTNSSKQETSVFGTTKRSPERNTQPDVRSLSGAVRRSSEEIRLLGL